MLINGIWFQADMFKVKELPDGSLEFLKSYKGSIRIDDIVSFEECDSNDMVTVITTTLGDEKYVYEKYDNVNNMFSIYSRVMFVNDNGKGLFDEKDSGGKSIEEFLKDEEEDGSDWLDE